jgi:3-oxoadipate enol-lactonase
MPMIESSGCPLHVEVEGPERAPVIMLCNSLGATLNMWDPQVAPFTKEFRLVRYDRRGHGRSGVTPGPYSMEQLGRDALAIMDGLGLERVNWCGLSMGGMVGQWLGANAPERIARMVISNTNYYYPTKDFWTDRIKTVREKGLSAIVDANFERWFTADFRVREPKVVAWMREMFLTSSPVEGYVACCAAVRDMDHRELLARIRVPTLIIAGRYDNAIPIEAGEFMRSRIANAALTIIDAAHISNVEQPRVYAAETLGFFAQAHK